MADNKSAGNVSVALRVRPLNKKELAMGATCCLDFHSDKQHITLNMSAESQSAFGANKFIFDRVFNMES